MKQWEIYYFPFVEAGRHPAIILSIDEIAGNEAIKTVNALFCSSADVKRPPKKYEVPLDKEDGFDWNTVVQCHKIHLLPKESFQEKIGAVQDVRQIHISRKIVELFRLRQS
jgi:mRNA-degrading endonuclease toxin of MazEF toxin-antitoxin module